VKIFDFSEGKRGRLLGYARRPTFSGPTFHDGNDWVKIKIAGCDYTSTAGRTGTKLENGAIVADEKTEAYEPGTYGLEAICFCEGKFWAGEDSFWSWKFLATDAWLAKRGYSKEAA
jgi:hypothetical protein